MLLVEPPLHGNMLGTVKRIRAALPEGKTIVFISGIFNVIHSGHTRLFHYAAEQGDYVVVGVFGDGVQKGAILSEEDRLHAVQSMSCVDYAFILRDSPEVFIDALRPDIVVKGREHQSRNNPELEALKNYGGRLLFSSGESRFSSLDLIRKEIREINFSTIDKSSLFPKRHRFGNHDLLTAIDKFGHKRVVIIGDTIVDEYVSCDAVGLSQEDPTVVVRPVLRDVFVGGAGIVAGHARGMGAHVRIFTVLGKDVPGKTALERLREYGVDVYAFEDDTRPTTLKRRYRANGKTLLRSNEFSQRSIDKELQNRIYESIAIELKHTDVLIFSDFNYGTLPQELVDRLTHEAARKGIMMVADSQCSSQIGDISRFRGMTLVTPTEHEARVAMRDAESGLVVLANKLREAAKAQHVVLTLGSEGVLIVTGDDSKEGEWITDQLPALNTAPKDPAGAGDALMVVASLALATGSTIWEAIYLGSLAAACQVGRVGNLPLNREELIREVVS